MMTENYENVNHLVLNFYPDGYSIAVKLNEFPVFTSETILETARISYEETSLLDYIENEELPPLLVEMIDSSPKLSQYKIWHNGCLILEVRDKIDSSNKSMTCDNHNDDQDKSDAYSYRSHNAAKLVSQSQLRYNNNFSASKNNHELPSDLLQTNNCGKMNDYDMYSIAQEKCTDKMVDKPTNRKYFILLKPTNLSILYDVLNLTDSKCWSTQERLQLESQIVLHNSPSLSLEPDEIGDQTSDALSDNGDAISYPTLSTEMDTNGNSECSTLKSRRSSFCKPRLKDIYMNRSIHVSYIKSNGGSNNGDRNNGNHSKVFNHYSHSQQMNNHDVSPAPEGLPPELSLHKFLASRRKTKQKSLPFSPTPRFHRYKKMRSYK